MRNIFYNLRLINNIFYTISLFSQHQININNHILHKQLKLKCIKEKKLTLYYDR